VLKHLSQSLNLIENGHIQTMHQITPDFLPALRAIPPEQGLLHQKGFTQAFKRQLIKTFSPLKPGAYWILLNERVPKDHPDAVYCFAYIEQLETGKTPEEADRLAMICRNAALEQIKKQFQSATRH
jgi:hypothetical protein